MKKILTIATLSASLLLTACGHKSAPIIKTTLLGISTTSVDYEQATSSFIGVSSQVLDSMSNGEESFTVYIGRPSCSTCQAFAPKLAEAASKTGAVIYYYNADDVDDLFYDFADKYQLSDLPVLMTIENGEISSALGNISEVTVDDILNYIDDAV